MLGNISAPFIVRRHNGTTSRPKEYQRFWTQFAILAPPGGGLPYERGGDSRRKFWIKPQKETNLGVAKPFFGPLKETISNFDYMNGVPPAILELTKRELERPHLFLGWLTREALVNYWQILQNSNRLSFVLISYGEWVFKGNF